MKTRRKLNFGILITGLFVLLCLAAAFSVPVNMHNAFAEDGDHVHNDTAFGTELGAFIEGKIAEVPEGEVFDYVLPEGNYYLEKEVVLSDSLKIRGTVKICLNGLALIYGGDGKKPVISVESGALSVYDCNSGVNRFSYAVGEDGKANFNTEGIATDKIFTVESGRISGGTDGGVKINSGAEFNLFGGTIIGNEAEYGGGIYVSENAVFSGFGGRVTANVAEKAGGGAYMNGTVNLSETLPYISENAVNGENNNLYLPKNKKISVKGVLDSEDRALKVGVSLSEDYVGAFTVDYGKHNNNRAELLQNYDSEEALNAAIANGDVTIMPTDANEFFEDDGYSAERGGEITSDIEHTNGEAAVTFTVTAYRSDDINSDDKQEIFYIIYGTSITVDNAEKAPDGAQEFRFAEWRTQINGGETVDLTQPVRRSYTVYPKFDTLYAIEYNLDGGVLPSDAPDKIVAGVGLDKMPVPTKQGYTFDGWYEDGSFFGDEIASVSADLNNTVTVYAKWIVPVAFVQFGENRKGFESLGSAFSYANNFASSKDGRAVVTLVKDVEISEGLTVGAGKFLTFDLNGNLIKLVAEYVDVNVITVNGDLYLTDGNKTTVHNFTRGADGFYCFGTGSEKANGGVITRKSSITVENETEIIEVFSGGSGVYVAENANFTMDGGTIAGHKGLNGSGGGVYVCEGAAFVMSGGSISGNTVEQRGGGVYAVGSFTMTAGTVIYNKAAEGGGVYLNDGSFDMSGGDIKNNKATYGGGVNVAGNSEFSMTAGAINANEASQGGGVYGALSVGDKVQITGNTDGGEGSSNVYLSDGQFITIIEKLTEGAKIGLSLSDTYIGKFTENYSAFNYTEAEVQVETGEYTEVEDSESGETVQVPVYTTQIRKTTDNPSVYFTYDKNSTEGGAVRLVAAAEKEEAVVYFTVTFYQDDGKTVCPDVAAIFVNYGETFENPGSATKPDTVLENSYVISYAFVEWRTATDETGVSYDFTAQIRVDTSVFASYRPTTTYNVYFNLNDGTFPEETDVPATYVSGVGLDSLPIPKKEGFAFEGWFTTTNFAEGTQATYIAPEEEGVKTFYAKWLTAVATVAFNGVTENYSSVKGAFNAANAIETSEENAAVITLCGSVNTSEVFTVDANSYISFDLNGFMLKYTGTEANSVITVYGNFVLEDKYEGEDRVYSYTKIDGLYVFGSGSEAIRGGVITRTVNVSTSEGSSTATAASGRGVQTGVLNGSCGVFVMNGGTIAGHYNNSGAGVYIGNNAANSFTMNGGAIVGNKSAAAGGGLEIFRGVFIMNGGKISDNTAGGRGGGITVSSSTASVTLKDGAQLKLNDAKTEGGGIAIDGSASVYMEKGSTISDNSANGGNGGGGIYMNIGSKLYMTGGSIVNNTVTGRATTGAGVYMWNQCVLEISGAPKIIDNTDGEGTSNNLFLRYNSYEKPKITIKGRLEDGEDVAQIGITLSSDYNGEITQGYGEHHQVTAEPDPEPEPEPEPDPEPTARNASFSFTEANKYFSYDAYSEANGGEIRALNIGDEESPIYEVGVTFVVYLHLFRDQNNTFQIQYVFYGDSAVKPENPPEYSNGVATYEFDRWITADSNTNLSSDYNVLYFGQEPDWHKRATNKTLLAGSEYRFPAVNRNVHIYPYYDIYYKINYVLDDDVVLENPPVRYKHGAGPNAVTFVNPTRPGYNFHGWFTDEALTKAQTSIYSSGSAGGGNDYTLYPYWIKTYVVSFYNDDVDNDGNPNPKLLYQDTVEVGHNAAFNASKATPTGNPTKVRIRELTYAFSGRWTFTTGSGENYSDLSVKYEQIVDGEKVQGTGDYNVYAKFNSSPRVYNIVYYDGVDANGNPKVLSGNANLPKTFTYGVGVDTLLIPTKANYRFLGWFSNKELTTFSDPIGPEDAPALDDYADDAPWIFYAKWIELDTVTVTVAKDPDSVFGGDIDLVGQELQLVEKPTEPAEPEVQTDEGEGTEPVAPTEPVTPTEPELVETLVEILKKNGTTLTLTIDRGSTITVEGNIITIVETSRVYSQESGKTGTDAERKRTYVFTINTNAPDLRYENTFTEITGLPENGQTSVNSSFTLTGNYDFEAQKYAVVYVWNDGTEVDGAAIEHTYNQATDLPMPTKEKHHFHGWCADETLNTLISAFKCGDNAQVIPAKTTGAEIGGVITLYAKWIELFTINFVVEDEVDNEGNPTHITTTSHTVEQGQTAIYKESGATVDGEWVKTGKDTPAREQTYRYYFVFNKWQLRTETDNGEGGTEVTVTDAVLTNIHDDFTVYANFDQHNRKFKLYFYDSEAAGNPVSSLTKEYEYNEIDSAFTLPQFPRHSKSGYNFKGWYCYDADDTEKSVKLDASDLLPDANGDKIYYAKWSKQMKFVIEVADDPDGKGKYGAGSVNTVEITTDDEGNEVKNYTDRGHIYTFMVDEVWNENRTLVCDSIIPTENTIFEVTWETEFYDGIMHTASVKFAFVPSEDNDRYTYQDLNTDLGTGKTDEESMHVVYTRAATAKVYNIIYVDLDGSDIENMSPSEYTYFVGVGAEDIPNLEDKTDYRFKGWFADSDCTEKVTSISKDETGDIILYSKWNEIYKVNFHDYVKDPVVENGEFEAQTIGDIKVVETGNPVIFDGTLPTKPSTDTETFAFSKWLNRVITERTEEREVTKNVQKLDSEGQPMFDAESGEPVMEEVTTTESFTVREISYEEVNLNKVTANWELYPLFTASPRVYEINYELDGGTNGENPPVEYTCGTAIESLPTPTKQKYRFLGWYLTAEPEEGEEEITEIPAESFGDITLYARWIEQITVKFMRYNGEGEPWAVYTVDKGQDVAYLGDTPSRIMDATYVYEFKMWVDVIQGNDKADYEEVDGKAMFRNVQEDFVVYARYEWIAQHYEIIYHLASDETFAEEAPTFYIATEGLEELPIPTKPSHNFVGWYTDEALLNSITSISVSQTGVVNLYPKWVSCIAMVTFDNETVQYLDFNEAVNVAFDRNKQSSAENRVVLKIMGNVTYGSTLTIENGQFISIDLNGYEWKFTGESGSVFTVNGNFILDDTHIGNGIKRIYNSVEVVGGAITGGKNGGVTVNSNGTFNLKNGNIAGNATAVNGGGVFVSGGKFVMDGGAVIANTATGNGGGVAIHTKGTMTVNDGKVTSNVSSGSYGGGIIVNGKGSEFFMTDSEISDNKSKEGGGIAAISGGTITVSGGNILRNTATTGRGGGVFINASATSATLSNVEISDNTSATNGGGVCVSTGTMTITDAKISNNTSNSSSTQYGGGGVAKSGAGVLEITCGEISGNNAGYGGGISIYNGGSGQATLTDVTIINNNASRQGGGIYVNNSTVQMNDCIVKENISKNNGGAISVLNTTIGISGGEIKGNKNEASTQTNGYGGGIAISGTSSVVTLENLTVTENTASYYGGGIALSSGNVNVLGAVKVFSNTAKNIADNVYLAKDKKLTVEGGLDGSDIGVNFQNTYEGSFTIGYADNHTQNDDIVAPNTYFKYDRYDETKGGTVKLLDTEAAVFFTVTLYRAEKKEAEASPDDPEPEPEYELIELEKLEVAFNVQAAPKTPESVNTDTTTESFVKWVSEIGGNTEVKFPKQITENMVVYATYKVEPRKFDIEYNLNGGDWKADETPVESYTYGEGLSEFLEPTRFGYEFFGWYDNADFNGEPIIGISATATGDYALYAFWVESTVDGSVKITLDGEEKWRGAKVTDAFGELNSSLYDGLSSINSRLVVTLLGDALADGVLTVNKNRFVTLDLNGFMLMYGGESGMTSAFITVDGDLLIEDTRNPAAGEHSYKIENGMYLFGEGASFDRKLQGGVITDGYNSSSRSRGGGISVNSGAFLTLNGGAVAGNYHSSISGMGGGIYVNNATFTMNGGSVRGNKSRMNGGGIYINGQSSRVYINGGEISENTAALGAGVYLNGGRFYISGGSVSNNTATTDGGGIRFTTGADNVLGVSGDARITDNIAANKDNNVHMNSAFKITVTDALTEGAKIGVTMVDGSGKSVTAPNGFTSGYGNHNQAAELYDIFVADDTNYCLKYDDTNNEVALVDSALTVTADGLTRGYYDFNIAFAAANAAGTATVRLLENKIISETAVIEEGNTITLDLNGFTLSLDGAAFGSVLEVKGAFVLNGKSGSIISGGKDGEITATADEPVEPTEPTEPVIPETKKLNGSGIFVNGGSFTMNGAEISGNKAVNGGGVYVLNGVFVLNGGVIKNNEAEYGGGIFVSNGNISFNGDNRNYATVGENSAVNGGAIYAADNSEISIVRGNISLNTASGNGGGAYVENSVINISGGTLNGNIANDGAGVYGVNVEFEMSGGAVISGNTASGNGGGIYVEGGKFAMNGGTVTLNEAVNGGGLYLYKGIALDARFAYGSNSEVNYDISGGTINKNTSTNGGGIYVADGSLALSGATVGENGAQYGGGIYLNDGAIDISANGKVLQNKATAAGGGVYINEGEVKLNGAVSENEASDGAGIGVYGGSVEISGAIEQNIASGSGGGVYLANGSVIIDGGEIKDNDAGGNGGGVEVNSGVLTMNSGSISGNEAGRGGGVNVPLGSSFEMSGGSIENNIARAENGGGGVSLSGSMALSGTPQITGNSSGAEGSRSNNNVYVYSGVKIDVEGEFGSGANVGITLGSTYGTFTEGYETYNLASPATVFKSDNLLFVVSEDGNKEAEFKDAPAAITVKFGEEVKEFKNKNDESAINQAFDYWKTITTSHATNRILVTLYNDVETTRTLDFVAG